MQLSICSISVNSKISSTKESKIKETISTKGDSKYIEADSAYQYTFDEEDDKNNSKVKQIQKRIKDIQASRQILTSKFQKIIQTMNSQIRKKQQMNAALSLQLIQMRMILQESKSDLNTIVTHLKKKQGKQIQTFKRTPMLNITKKSGQLDKSNTASTQKNSIDTQHNSFNPQRKNQAAKIILLKKSFKF